jgi:HSP20 family protein
MSLVKCNPMHNLIPIPDEVLNVFNPFGFGWENSDVVWSPSVDLSETEDKYEITAEVPGMKKEDIRVSFDKGVLTLNGERKFEEEKKGKNYHRMERSYGRFERSFQLPEEVKPEQIKAVYQDGVLSVEIPKTEKPKPKSIEVS